MQNIREMHDWELEIVCGGSAHPAYTDTGVDVHASATGGYLHFDTALATTKSISMSIHGESISTSIGFSLALAL